MNIANSTAVQTASGLAQTKQSDALNMLVLKKALDMQASSAASLLQALPQPPLAPQGQVGSKLNTYA